MGKQVLIRFIFVCFIFLFIPLFRSVFAATLQFDPTTIKTSAGQTFEVKINVNAGTDQIISVDAYILYDKTLLEAQSVTDGTFFPTASKYLGQDGKVYAAGVVDDINKPKTGAGTIATVVFKGKKSGTLSLTFDCTNGSLTDSNVLKNDANNTDIIQCASNGKASVTIGAGASSGQDTTSPTATPTLTSSSGSSREPTQPASQLPQTGIIDNILKYSVPGIILLVLGGAVRLMLL